MAFIDFVFHSGNYVESKDLFDYIEIFLDPIVIIITFILGFWLSNYSIKKKENIELDSLFDYFKIYVENQLQQISKQIIEIETQQKKISNLKNMGGLTIINIQPLYFILEGINKQQLLKSWIRKGNIDQKLIIILKYFNFTKLSFDNYQSFHSGFLERQNLLRDKWNNSIKNLHDFKLSTSNKPREELSQSDDFIFFNSLYNTWGNLKNPALEDTINLIVQPLENHFQKIFNKNPENHFAAKILEKVQAIDIVYLEWKAEVENYKKYLYEILPQLKKGLEEINEIKF